MTRAREVDVVQILERAGFEVAEVRDDPEYVHVAVKKTRPKKGEQIPGQMALC